MALVRTDYTPDSHDDSGSDARTTGSYTIPNNALGVVIAKVVNDYVNDIPDLTISDSLGASWTSIVGITRSAAASAYEPAAKAWYLTGDGSARTITITAGTGGGALNGGTGAANIRRWRIEVYSFTGHNTSSPIGFIGSSDTLPGSGSGSLNLSGTTASDSQVFGSMVGTLSAGTTTIGEGSGWTELYDSPSTDWMAQQSQVVVGSISTVEWSDMSVDGASYEKGPIGLGFEIKAAPAAAADYYFKRNRVIVVDTFIPRS